MDVRVVDLGVAGPVRAGQPGDNQSASGRRATPAGQAEPTGRLPADLRSCDYFPRAFLRAARVSLPPPPRLALTSCNLGGRDANR